MKFHPLSRHASLIIKELSDETLVYDLNTDQAHCLNQTAAKVWQNCDGETSVSEIARRLSSETDTVVDENVVWLALDQLEKFKLLDQPLVKPAAFLSNVSRRQVIRALGVAAIVLPMVSSLVVPTAAQGGSPVILPPNTCCKDPSDCLTNDCRQPIVGELPCTVYPPNPQNSTKRCA